MVNYSLEEFRAWLEEKPERKKNLPYWSIYCSPGTIAETIMADNFQEVCQRNRHDSNVLLPYNQVFKKWKAEVDQREREREREREQIERNNMIQRINAQEFLNEKLPAREKRAKITSLCLTKNRNRDYTRPEDTRFGEIDLVGELDLSDFISLTMLYVEEQANLTKVIGLEKCEKLLVPRFEFCPKLQPPLTIVEWWKAEITQLKAQLAEYEREETSSQTSTESSYSNLTTKIAQKKQELAQLRDTTRKPTKFLRKEIELLEKLQSLAHKVSELEEKEANYRQQLSQKEQTISQKQGQIEQLKAQEQQSQTKIKRLEKQITDLTTEKQALQERMLQERQAALNDWNQEKTGLTSQITQLNEQKDTFQKSADYLRETLRGTEKSLEDVKRELAESQTQNQTNEQTYQQSLAQKEEVLRQRNEAFRVLQERNVGLQANLTKASEENSQLSQWISQLEGASVEGDAFVNLKAELAKSQQAILSLEEQLSAKPGKSYWWVYLLLVAGAVYLVMS